MDNQKKLEIKQKNIYLIEDKKNMNFRAFRQKYNMKEKNFHIQLRNKYNEITKNTLILKEEYHKKKRKTYQLENNKIRSKSAIIQKDNRKKCKKVINILNNNLNHLQNENIELNKINELNLYNTSKKLLIRPHSSISLMNNKDSLLEITEKIQNSSNQRLKRVNLIKINDHLRKSINLSLYNFNPISNLKDLYYIKKNNPEIWQNIERMKIKINNRIKDELTGRFYKKKYEKVKKNNLRKSNESINKFNKGIQRTKSTNFLSFNTSKNNFFNISNLKDKEEQNKEYKLMEDSIEPLSHTLEINSIIKFIDETVKDKNKNKINLLEKKNIYFPNLSKTEKAIENLVNFKISKEIENKNKEDFKIFDYEDFSVMKKYEESKEELINDYNKIK